MMTDDVLTPTVSLSAIAENSGHIGYDWDKATDRVVWTGSWAKIFEAAPEAIPATGQAFAAMIPQEDQAFVLDETDASFDKTYRLNVGGIRHVWVHDHGVIILEGGRIARRQGLIAVIEDPESHPHISAHNDPLTGRPNRAAMMARLRYLLLNPFGKRDRAAFMVVNVDRMAFLNEALGMRTADALLCRVADRIVSHVPQSSLLARIGGDSFGVLIMDSDPSEVGGMVEKLLEGFHDTPVHTPYGPIHVTVSIGTAFFRADMTDPAEVMIHAEHARQLARQKGPNSHVGYHESGQRSEESRKTLETIERVRRALRDGTLHLAFQPVIDAQTKQVLFYEALARMFDDAGNLMPAADFIPVVERLGLAPEFDRHVLNLAIKELEEAPGLSLAVNISGLTAALSDWSCYVQGLLASKPDVARRLIIEITETAAIMDVAETKLLVESLKNMGSRVALDDFGAGATSISHLRNLGLAIMKIDKDLLKNLMTSVEQQHLVRMLIRIAHGLNLKTVVEGIETPDVAEWLRIERADMLQGYLFGYPLLDKPWRDETKKEA